MNRSQRRASQKLGPGFRPASAPQDAVMTMFENAVGHHRLGDLSAAALLFKKILALRPDHAAARDQLALVYLAQGKLAKASAQFAELAHMVPQTLSDFSKVVDMLKRLMPTLAAALSDSSHSSIQISSAQALLAAQGAEAIAANLYFRTVLESTVVRDAMLERWLTALRAAILRAALASEPHPDDDILAFCSSLAQQCFINEYVFAVAPDELEQVERLKSTVADALAGGVNLHPLRVVALAMYAGLHELVHAQVLTERKWPAAVAAVVTQQVREPLIEQQLRATIPRLTPISDGVSAEVRQQYEENPYPRWVRMGAPPTPLRVLDDYIRQQFPAASFRPVGHNERLDILVAGCGTGRHALDAAQGYRGARVLGVDLSLSSLSSAKRKTPPALAGAIEFAQGDILSLGSIGRSFDLINAAGVFHHMGDPLAGWRELIKLMRPNGLMHVGLYSEHARHEIVAARNLIAERGYSPRPEDIRRCRQELLSGPEQFKFMGLPDFFTISECRDLMFHVHEQRFTIPEIKAFLVANDLKFIGFDIKPDGAHRYHHEVFARAGWSAGDLDRWDAYERENPEMFAGMYIFWVQKN